MKKSRLPRRYDKALATLRRLADSKNERLAFQAAMRITEIMLHFDQSQERVAIATARASARKAEAEAGRHDAPADAVQRTDALKSFLATLAVDEEGIDDAR